MTTYFASPFPSRLAGDVEDVDAEDLSLGVGAWARAVVGAVAGALVIGARVNLGERDCPVKALVDASTVLADLILGKLIGDVAPQSLACRSLQVVIEVAGEADEMRWDMRDLRLRFEKKKHTYIGPGGSAGPDRAVSFM